MSKEPVGRTTVSDLDVSAIQELDTVIAWCDALMPAPLLRLKKDEAA